MNERDTRVKMILIEDNGITAHELITASADFTLVGAYPEGQSPDMNYGKKGERSRADRNNAQVQLPRTDPVFGPGGPLSSCWTE